MIFVMRVLRFYAKYMHKKYALISKRLRYTDQGYANLFFVKIKILYDFILHPYI